MSLGRPEAPRTRRIILAAILAVVVVAAVAGYYIAVREGGEGGDALISEKLRSLGSTLDLMLIEYSEAVENGYVRLESEYQVALSLAARASKIYSEIEAELSMIDRDAALRLGELIDEIVDMVEAREDPELVREKVEEALGIIEYLLGAG